MKKFILSVGIVLTLSSGIYAKKALDHDAFDHWELVGNRALSNNGQWSAFGVEQQEGDGVLTFLNTSTGKKIEIPRGKQPSFTADGKWGIALVKPFFSETRKAKIDKKKDFDMPQDSLAIVNLAKGTVEMIPRVISYKIGKEGGNWLAYQSCDTNYIKPAALKDKEAGRPVVVRDLTTGNFKIVNWVDNYTMSRDGLKVALTIKKQEKDSLSTNGLGILMLPDTCFKLIDRDKKHYNKPVFNRQSDMIAYTASNDSNATGTRRMTVYTANLKESIPYPTERQSATFERKAANLNLPSAQDPETQQQLEQVRNDLMAKERGKELVVNQYAVPEFSRDGKRLIVGVAPIIAPDDTTIVDFERAELDIWRWDAPYTPPQEKSMISTTRKANFPMVIDLKSDSYQLLTTNPLVKVQKGDYWNSDWALLKDPTENIVSFQWDYCAPIDIQIKNVNTGELRNVGTVPRGDGDFSAHARYVLWFKDRNYYAYSVATGETVNISKDIPFPLWDEDSDYPGIVTPYGMACWTQNDDAVLIYDRHDIWSLDPTGKRAPINLTNGEGRKNNLRYRFQNTDPEFQSLKNGEMMLLTVFNYENKYNGLATLKYGAPAKPQTRTLRDMTFSQILKAKDADVFSWQMSNFSCSPNLYCVRGYNFNAPRQMTNANPQMAEYNWGTAELVKWYAYDGKLTEGVLYKPEDFDPNKKYPMLCVFYETNSENLYLHYTMQPSWSWINYPFYVSRGYVVFVPDIHYTAGVPGECAYNCVCSGVEELCKKYDWIDKDRIGIDGQSWGGYQTAYLVTRTNMFACAGSGAPVSNMTSAFGGIRWGSGDSRMSQYEQGQSRIGRNLWDATNLYLANSPVFYANRVNTPLLIMHNDNDGAVPWYQGIEMFMALRRLNKPVWMLQYNGEEHNLIKRKNRKDITIRLQQFFDHYLKGDPMPDWMKHGIPMIRKGQEMGTGFSE